MKSVLRRSSLTLLMLLSLPWAGTALAVPPPAQDSESQTADAYFAKQDWPNAEKGYAVIVAAEPGNGKAWYRLGVSRQSQGEFKEAVDAYLKAEAIGHNPVVMFNLATAYARLGDKENALGWLEKAVGAGFSQVQQAKNDPDLDSLRGEPRFKALLEKMEGLAHPCETSPQARQFDFWVGSWEVRTPDGQRAGTNQIQRILAGCALLENWKGAKGGTGKSLNTFNQYTGKWQQTWVDDAGDITEFVDGEYKDQVMRFRAETKSADGKVLLRHLSFFNLGADKVRQFSEQSTDGGKTWSTEYDLTYTRVAEPASEFPNMVTYFLVLLKKGPKWSPQETPERQRIQEAHLEHIRKLGESGKVILAGPFSDDGDLRGALLFKVGAIEEARRLESEDPAVVAGRLVMELHPWLVAKGVLP
jgi:tetratricopeptide (TPR) repeat protein